MTMKNNIAIIFLEQTASFLNKCCADYLREHELLSASDHKAIVRYTRYLVASLTETILLIKKGE